MISDADVMFIQALLEEKTSFTMLVCASVMISMIVTDLAQKFKKSRKQKNAHVGSS
jgi:hypothetical protein